MSLRKANLILSAVLLAFAGWVMYLATGFRDPRTGQIPMALGVLIALGAVVMLALNLVPNKGAAIDDEKPYADVPWAKWSITAGMLALYAAGLRPLGFYESGAIFLIAISYLLTGDKSNKVAVIRNSVIFGVVGAAVLWLMFDIVLGIPTEKGILI